MAVRPPWNTAHFPFRHRLAGNWRVISLEPGTCCYRATTFFTQHAFEETPEIVVAPTFSHGIASAAGNQRDLVMLPHVHETCSELTTNIEWEQLVEFTFPYDNPPLVLARRPGSKSLPGDRSRCATIERLKPLLNADELHMTIDVVHTTQEAARVSAAAHGPDFCITNQHGAECQKLEIVRVLKHMTIWWLPFRSVRRGAQ